jgi:hypothetical protein
MRSKTVLRRALGSAITALLLAVGPSAAAQQQNANAYAYWSLSAPGGIWNVDQDIRVRKSARSTFWAGLWTWQGMTNGGYFGLQKNAPSFHGTKGSIAIFSIWNANGAKGAHCGVFGGEGGGQSCHIGYTPKADRLYRLRLWRQEKDALGQWWGAWIQDQTTGIESWIGGIRAPVIATLVGDYKNFTEFFGSTVRAPNRVPKSIADYTQPAANQQSPGLYQSVGSFSGSTVGSGTSGNVQLVSFGWTNAARVTMGG